YGVGVSSNITRASVRAIFSAMNRLQLGDRRQGISDSF
ncbi:MAG: alpha-isopropylmalate synthase regulatory domain-containing protein, partial [Lachnospiraceae bacterium]